MNQLYLECYSGISGDMVVAALLDLGADRELLLKTLKTVPAEGFRIHISRVKKAGLDACDFDVILDDRHDNHDHDMEYLYGKGAEHQEAGNSHGEHGHPHEHRGMKEVLAIIAQTDMTERARQTAIRIFTILGEAEARAHGATLEEVHFHEVGAVDSIVDIIAAAVCLDQLDIQKCVIPVLYEGCGTIRCRHGILPVPVPAVANIAAQHRLCLHRTDREGELVTPTGAAIAAAIRTSDQLPSRYTIERTGTGAGKRAYEAPSLLRAMLIREEEGLGGRKEDTVYKLESNIDDCSGESLGHLLECLMEAGARDVNYMPVYMKKNRPAYQLNVICRESDIPKLEQIIFRETTTIGIRRCRMERSVLERETIHVETALGTASVKICRLGEERRVYPEYDSVAALCRNSGKPFPEVFRLVEREGYERI